MARRRHLRPPGLPRPLARKARRARQGLDRRHAVPLEGRRRRTRQRRQGQVRHHREGIRRHRTDLGVQHGSARRLRHLPPQRAAGPDLGPRQRQGKEERRRQGQRRALEQRPEQRQVPARPRRQGSRRVEHAAHRHGRRPRQHLAQRPADRRPRQPRELLRPETGRAGQGPDLPPDARRPDPLAQHLRPRNQRGRSQQVPRLEGHRRLQDHLQRQGPDRLEGRDGPIRGRGWRHLLQTRQRRQSLPQGRPDRLRRPPRIQGAGRRQQRPLPPLPRHRQHRLRRHVRTPGVGRQLRQGEGQARPSPGARLGLRHGRRPARLPAPHRRMEFPGSHRQGLDHQG